MIRTHSRAADNNINILRCSSMPSPTTGTCTCKYVNGGGASARVCIHTRPFPRVVSLYSLGTSSRKPVPREVHRRRRTIACDRRSLGGSGAVAFFSEVGADGDRRTVETYRDHIAPPTPTPSLRLT